MTVSLTHQFVSAQPDDPDTTLIRPSNWNAQHTLTGAANQLLGFNASGVATEVNPATIGGAPGGATNTVQYNTGSGFGGVGPLTNGQLVIGQTGGVPVAATLTAGTNVTITTAPGAITINAAGGTGAPGGTANQIQYNNSGAFGGIGPGSTTQVLHGGTPGAFAAVNLATDVTGTLPAANGGVGTLTNGQLLIGSTGSAPVAAQLTAGANVTITPGPGSITIAASGTGGSTSPGGSSNSIQYNNAGAFGGIGPLTNGQLLIGSTGAAPVAASLTAGSNVTITPGAGTITIAASGTGGGGVTVSDTAPASPTQGQLWWQSSSGLLSMSYTDVNSTQWVAVGGATAAGGTVPAPQQTVLTTGSGTYTTPSGATWIEVELVGGGGGGGGGVNATAAGSGTASTFGTSLLTAGGGGGSSYSASGAAGTASGGTINITGSAGASSGISIAGSSGSSGGVGGSSYFGGGGGGTYSAAGGNAATNSGSGGAGGGATSAVGASSGYGGSSGGYCRTIITSPAASYSYSVGNGGNGAAAGSNGFAGGNGAAGIIIVRAHFGG